MTDETQSTLMSLFLQYLAPVLFSALATALTWALAKLAAKWGAQGKEAKLAATGAWAAHLASTVVADLEATVVAEFKAAAADGVLTKAEIARIRETALGRLKALMGEHGLEQLRKALGIWAPELDKYLLGLLEKSVALLPKDPAPASPR